MTYAELIHAVALLLSDRAFAVYIEYWNHEGRETLNWKIWDSVRGKHFEGKTAEAALQCLHHEIAQPSVSDGIAAVQVPALKVEEEIPF